MKLDRHLCNMSAKLFVLSVKMGIDSENFVDKLFNSDIANVFYKSELSTNWLGEEYVMSVMDYELKFSRGKTYEEEFMYWAGYIYKAWNFLYENDSPREILKQAPLSVLRRSYTGLHVMPYEMAVEDLKEMYKENSKEKV